MAVKLGPFQLVERGGQVLLERPATGDIFLPNDKIPAGLPEAILARRRDPAPFTDAEWQLLRRFLKDGGFLLAPRRAC
jgi:hypothetical protein